MVRFERLLWLRRLSWTVLAALGFLLAGTACVRQMPEPPPSAAPLFVPADPSLAFGVPGTADAVLKRTGYALGFSERHRQAVWVSYQLTSDKVRNREAKRTNRFLPDPDLSGLSADDRDYLRSGFDRGHLAAAADMAWSARAMAESFYYSNMSPQRPGFNRGIWARLEKQVRHTAAVEREIYVVTGPVLPQTPSLTIGPHRVTVPEAYYKVIYDATPPRKMIGFLLKNQESSRPLKEFAVTVDAVEKLTGLDFFSALPPKEQENLESTVIVGDWSWIK